MTGRTVLGLPPSGGSSGAFQRGIWVDFVRNVLSPTTKQAMQQHIHNACSECVAKLQMWQSVVAIAANEKIFAPPEDTVRVVRSQLAAVSPEASGWIPTFVRLRSAASCRRVRGSVAARQFLHETDDDYIDLRLERRKEAHRACVVGQVLNRTGKEWMVD